MANEMRDRLKQLLRDANITWETAKIADRLIENGVIVPPCKVGQKVYAINLNGELRTPLQSDRITQIKINRGGYHFKCWWGYFHLSDIGKTVFLTKAEAEQKLKEMRGDNNV